MADILQQPSPTEENILLDVSERSTKADLIKAYKTLLKRQEDHVHTKKGEQVKRATDQQLLQKAGTYTVETLIRHLEEMKLELANGINALSQKLVDEAKKFEDISQATALQEKRIKELHDIETATTNLEDLIKAQETKKELFEEEYERIKLARKHEEEEYDYAIKQERKKEEDMRREREEVIRKREEELKEREQELQELRRKGEASPVELEQAIEKSKEETSRAVRNEMQIKIDIVAKETAGDKKVWETRIAFLEETIANQREENSALKRELEQAIKQVQSIAEKAIEGSSGKQTLKAVSDIAMQQASHPS